MPSSSLTLITGRTTQQGTGISTGKYLADYRSATTVIELNPVDMERLGLQDGDTVKLKTRYGETNVQCRSGDLPQGLAFMAYGPATSVLVGGETHASGMPDTKGFEIELERIPD